MLKATFKLADVQIYVQQQLQVANKALLNAYLFTGETFVRNARINGNYNDITGNLRSSVGYILIQDGQMINMNFEEAANGSDRLTGVAIGQQFADELSISYPKGLALICVAGMNYALYVEAKGLDVITDSSLKASSQLKSLLAQL